MLLEGYIEFENEIPVTLECLGKEYSIKIAGVTGCWKRLSCLMAFMRKKNIRSNQFHLDYSLPRAYLLLYCQ